MNSTLVAGTTVGRAGKGNDGRFGLRAKLTAGVATLGCAAALAVGGLWVNDTAPARTQVAPAVPSSQVRSVDQRERQRFLEQNQLPDGILQATVVPSERQRFLEANTLLPTGQLPSADLDDPRTMPR